MGWIIEYDQGRGFDAIRVEADLDLYCAARFAGDALRRVESGCKAMLVDLGGVEYLDSSGVGAIIRLLQRMAKTRGRIAFCGVKGTPRKVLEMCNVISIMRAFDDEAQAAAHLVGGRLAGGHLSGGHLAGVAGPGGISA